VNGASILSVLVPITIASSMLISSTVPETEYPAWTVGATFAAGDRCIANHRIYESGKASNTGKDPTDLTNQAGTPPWWFDIGPSNMWAMFDDQVSTQTAVASPLTVVLQVGGFNAVSLLGLDADSLTVTVRDAPAGTVIYSYTGSLESSTPGDYDEYFFDPFRPQTEFLATNIDQYQAMEMTITLTKTTGMVKCGAVSVGDLRELARTLAGAKAKPKTYSYIKTDDFGVTTIKRRKSATDMSLTAYVELADATFVNRTIADLLDVPCLWIASNLPQFSSLQCFGLGSGEVSFDDPQGCLLSLNVQGLI
jgi:hypothetical protein